MLTSTFLVSTDKRLRAYLIGGLIALMVGAGSVAYEVRSGDTLSTIASKHGVSLQAILEHNSIANPDLIRPGQEIVIPGGPGGLSRVHVVAAGETLGSIALSHKATVAAIAKANELSNPNYIRIGQKLAIPAAAGSAASGSYHVVAAGETLASIAAKYGVSVNSLVQANGIVNPSLIYEGTRLALSGDGFVAETAAGGSSSSHTVKAGETLMEIAGKYGVSVSDLARANDLADINRIRAGQTLTIPGGGGWVCPVTGATYVNDFGVPKTDGRFHQGIDLFAPRGTEVRAPVSGEVNLVTGTLGGLQFFLHGDDGAVYIGTHLEAFGRAGRVEAGHVIGYVGDTGNARGGPTHLHFEIQPKGGKSVNPFPTLQKAGC